MNINDLMKDESFKYRLAEKIAPTSYFSSSIKEFIDNQDKIIAKGIFSISTLVFGESISLIHFKNPMAYSPLDIDNGRLSDSNYYIDVSLIGELSQEKLEYLEKERILYEVSLAFNPKTKECSLWNYDPYSYECSAKQKTSKELKESKLVLSFLPA